MSKKKSTEKDENNPFEEAMRGVKPLAGQNKVDFEPTHEPRPKMRAQMDTASPPAHPILSDNLPIDRILPDSSVNFHRGGVHEKTLRRLRQGKLPIEAELDLHGYTVQEAKSALITFLLGAGSHCRVIRIIHGKGRTQSQPATLKNHVCHWLTQLDRVLAYTSAKPQHGGTGAVYVLLRSSSIGTA